MQYVYSMHDMKDTFADSVFLVSLTDVRRIIYFEG